MLVNNVAQQGFKVKKDGTLYNETDGAANSMGVYNFVVIDGVDPISAPTGYIFTSLKAINGPVVLAGIVADTNAPITGAVAGDTIRDADYLQGRFKTVTRSIQSVGKIYAYLGR